MATLLASGFGTALNRILLADDIEPGEDVSYQLAKLIYTYHPLGKKLADAPITLAQSQEREISVSSGTEAVRVQFENEWKRLGIDGHIFNIGSLSRVYGASAIVMLDGTTPSTPVDWKRLADRDVSFNVLDPLNVSGSLVMNMDPNSPEFMRSGGIKVQGTVYDRTRTILKLNEKPIYLQYSNSSYGYSGRSVYQRALFPLKSFLRTMITDDMVSRKAGLIVAKMKAPGSIVDGIMTSLFGVKRQMLKDGETDNVLGISPDDSIETLDLNNVNAAMSESRKNIIHNIAASNDMPAIILNSETYVEGFGEGTEDAKNVARYIGGVRDELQPVYDFFDRIVMYRAWDEAFYETVKADLPEPMSYEEAFQSWKNSFKALWPSLIEEPDSEKIKVAEVKLNGVLLAVQTLGPMMDPENKATLIGWAADGFNELEDLFPAPLNLDLEALAAYEPPVMGLGGEGGGQQGQNGQNGSPKKISAADSVTRKLRAA